ncbi:zinc finger BED domain-containing protein RICESLEEPER 2 [Tanacetum coccineum]
MATQSGSTTIGVGSSSAPTILQIISTTRNLQIWKDFHLCKMSDNMSKAQCIHCFHFFSIHSNSTLKNHISHPHCEALKTVPEPGQSSMSRDGSVFVYNPDAVREQFTGLVIQEGLPFNHFDNTRMTRVFQNHLQPKYTHAKHDRLATSEYERYVESDFVSHLSTEELAATSVASESAFSISGRVLSIRRKRLTPASLEMCMCLKDHMDAAERFQHTSNHKNSLEFEAEILEEEVQEHKAIELSDEEVAMDEVASEARSSEGGEIYDMTLSESD